MMKRIVCLLLACLVLTACVPKTETPTGTETLIPGETESPIGTITESETETTIESETEPPVPDLEEAAAALVGQMTLRQKIGQMLMPALGVWQDEAGTLVGISELNEPLREAIRTLGIGGVILFAESTTGTASTVSLTTDLQNAALSDGSLSGLPLLIGVDQEGGTIVRLGTGTSFCGNMALGAVGDPAAARQTAEIMSEELAALGINLDFAPVLDVNNNPANPIISLRSFSDDPALTASLGCAFLEGLHNGGTAAALKHFPGHGATATDSHNGLPSIEKTLDELMAFELIPYRAAIEAGTDVIMTAHIQYPLIETESVPSAQTGEMITLPATLSRTIITGVLREKLGYDGVVTTDALDMGAITVHFDPLDAARLAINAGVDILLMPVHLTSEAGIAACADYIDGIAGMVESGAIAAETVTKAACRIVRLKMARALIDTNGRAVLPDRDTAVSRALAAVGSAGHHELEWEIAEKAVTLVKNENDTLPIELLDDSRVVVFCSYENEVTAAEYAVNRLMAEGKAPSSALCEIICYRGHTPDEFADTIAAADAVVASVETGKTAQLTDGWQAEFLDALIPLAHGYGKTVTVISIQLPYDLARYQAADALVACYNPIGMNTVPTAYEGETPTYGPNIPAAMYAVFGGCDITGKLPVSIPGLDDEYNFTDRVLYERGFGLTISK